MVFDGHWVVLLGFIGFGGHGMLTLEQRIAQFYDTSSGLWEQTWGEHMHHGYYGVDGKIEELLSWGQALPQPGVLPEATPQILDVGCGIGGSSLYLAGRLQAEVKGITLSPVQAQRARERAQMAGLGARVEFAVANALAMPFADNSFDLVWSLESGEHMPDKQQFLQECCRVLRPGGKLILATWCHRPTPPALSPTEQDLLQRIYDVYCLPGVISLPDYKLLAEQLPLSQVQTADWSIAVAPFWDIVIDSALNPLTILGILSGGWTTIQATWALGWMAEGYRNGLIRYGLMSGIKTAS
jgi:tocopherol O-methyltransferase